MQWNFYEYIRFRQSKEVNFRVTDIKTRFCKSRHLILRRLDIPECFKSTFATAWNSCSPFGRENAWKLVPFPFVPEKFLSWSNEAMYQLSWIKWLCRSCDLWRNTDGVADWWVHLEETDEVAKKSDAKKNAKPPNRHHLGLFVHRQGRRRAANAKAQAKAKAAAKKSEKVPESKPPKAKKVKKTILKKFKEPQEIPETVANYTRTHKGDQLVQQVMNKARRLDSIKFPGEELFSVSNGFCKLKFKNCEGVHWDKFQQAAHGYFKCSSLGLGFCFIRFSQWFHHFHCFPNVWSFWQSYPYVVCFPTLASEVWKLSAWALVQDGGEKICWDFHSIWASPAKPQELGTIDQGSGRLRQTTPTHATSEGRFWVQAGFNVSGFKCGKNLGSWHCIVGLQHDQFWNTALFEAMASVSGL